MFYTKEDYIKPKDHPELIEKTVYFTNLYYPGHIFSVDIKIRDYNCPFKKQSFLTLGYDYTGYELEEGFEDLNVNVYIQDHLSRDFLLNYMKERYSVHEYTEEEKMMNKIKESESRTTEE